MADMTRLGRTWITAMASAAALLLSAPTTGSAEGLSAEAAIPPVSGVCAAASSLTMAVFPAVPLAAPTGLSVSISGSASCLSDVGTSTMGVSLGGTVTLSCLGGTTVGTAGALLGTLSWSPSPPSQVAVQANVVAGPDSLDLVMTGNLFQADAVLAWTGAPLCTGSTTRTALSGVIAFASEA